MTRVFSERIALLRSRVATVTREPARMLTVLLFGAAALTMLLTFRDYGISWDEQWQSIYGEYIISWYQSFFNDDRALDYWNLKYYGGFFDLLANSLARFSPLDKFDTRHLVSAAFGLIGMIAAFRIGSHLHSREAGLLAALFLLLIPMWYGHAFNNGKDIPFAAMFGVAVYYLVRMMRELPTASWSLVLKFGVAAGLALGIRVGGILLLFYYAVAFAFWFATHQVHAADALRPWPALRSFGARFLGASVIAYAIMLVMWPAAQVRPLAHPIESFRIFGRFPGPPRLLFEGQLIPTDQVPWYYLPKWMLLTMPEFVLAGMGIGIGLLVWRARRIAVRDPRFGEFAIVTMAATFPIVYTAITQPTLYDGMRHFLFVVPPLATLAALAWVVLLRSTGRSRYVLGTLLGASMLFTVYDMIQLHPHQYIYFNRAVAGGLPKAARSYETEYWGTSYREGAEWVAAHYKPSTGEPINVTSCSYPFSTTRFLPRNRFRYVAMGSAEADLFLATTRNRCHERFEGRVVHVVSRQGTPLLYVKELPRYSRPVQAQ